MLGEQLLRRIVMGELATAMGYRQLAMECEHEGVRELLQLLSDDSIEHARKMADDAGDLGEEIERGFTAEMACEGGWSVERLLGSDPGDPVALLEAGIEAENAAAGFYASQAQQAENAADRQALEEMVAEEQGHARALASMLRKLTG